MQESPALTAWGVSTYKYPKTCPGTSSVLGIGGKRCTVAPKRVSPISVNRETGYARFIPWLLQAYSRRIS
jgi:hypothetical protein